MDSSVQRGVWGVCTVRPGVISCWWLRGTGNGVSVTEF